MTTASRDSESTRMEQLHWRGPTGRVSITGLLMAWLGIDRDDGVDVVPLHALRGRPDPFGGSEVQLDGPFLIVGPTVLGLEELPAAGRSEDLPADVSEVRDVLTDVEGGDALARLDGRFPNGRW